MDIYTLAGARLKRDAVESTSVVQNPIWISTSQTNLGRTNTVPPLPEPLAATASRSAAHALIATAIPHHDRSADVATGSVSHVDHAGQSVGGVDGSGTCGG